MSHPFLSEEWMAEARAIRERYAGQTSKVTQSLKINQVVTGVPFGEGTVESYLDTSSGDVVMEFGSLEDADVTVTTDYETAKAIFVEQDPAAGHAGVPRRQDHRPGRHDEADGDADGDARPTRRPSRSPRRSRRSPPDPASRP